MKNIFNTEFKVGATVIIATLILIFGIIWGKGYRLQTHKYQLELLFDNIGGMVIGDPVTVNGVKAGKVQKIGWKDRLVFVTVELDDHIQLYEDATFIIVSAELLAGMRIEIFPGDSPNHLNMAKQPFHGKYGGRIVDVGLTIDALAKDLSSLSFRLDTTFAMVNKMLATGQLQNDLVTTLDNLKRFSQELKQVSPNLSNMLDNLDKSIKNLNSFVVKNDKGLSTTFKKFNSISAKLDTVSSSLQLLMRTVENQEGTLGKMVYDPGLYNDLSKTLRSLDSLSKKIKDDGLKLDLF